MKALTLLPFPLAAVLVRPSYAHLVYVISKIIPVLAVVRFPRYLVVSSQQSIYHYVTI